MANIANNPEKAKNQTVFNQNVTWWLYVWATYDVPQSLCTRAFAARQVIRLHVLAN